MSARPRGRPAPPALRVAAPALAAALLLAAPLPGGAQEAPPVPQTFDWWEAEGIPAETPWGQRVDTLSTRLIRSWTTMPEYTSPLVDHLPASGDVVSPTDHFGHPVGKPGVLHRVDEIYGYFDALAASTPRVRFRRLGETEEGNRLALARVGSEANLARLREVKEGLNALADPRETPEAEARRLVESLPAVYTFYAGLHSPETGPPEMVMELAYRLAVSDAPEIRTIRDSAIVFIVPVAEPDGRNRVVEWHRRHNRDAYDPEDRVPGPPYWGSYIFHDNNRDGLQLTARLTRELKDLFLEWKHPVGHDLHESVPYLYISTGTGPYNPTVDPITVSEWQWFSNYSVTALTAEGMPGVWTHDFYTGWYPGYLLWVTNTRNAVGRFYETFGNSVPNTMERTLGERSTSVEWFRPNPPRDTTLWSLRNNTNYMQSGALEALTLVARNRTRVLDQFRRKSLNSLRKGRTEAPYAYVVPVEQERKADAAYMLDLLRRQGIEVHRATAGGSFAAGEEEPVAAEPGSSGEGGAGEGGEPAGPAADSVEVAAGDYVVRMDQPYRNFVLTLMRAQEYPEDGRRPYDDVAWTYPMMFNVVASAVADSAVLDLPMERVGEAEIRIPGRVRTVEGGEGRWWYAVRPVASAHQARARWSLAETPVDVAEVGIPLDGEADEPGEDREAGGSETGGSAAADAPGEEEKAAADEQAAGALPPGAWLIRGDRLSDDGVRRWAERSGVEALRIRESRIGGVPRHEMNLPRLALLHSWRYTQDSGWARYALDHFGIPYEQLAVDELGGADLRDRFDVILFPSQGRGASGKRIFEGIDPEHGPLPYTRTDDHPTHGHPDAGEDITGGMGYEGLVALRDFVDGGGAFVTLASASTLPVEFGLLRDVSLADPGGTFIPGSIVRGRVARERSPVTYGYGEELPLFHQFGPYFRLSDELEGHAVVEYAGASELFMSGLVQGGSRIAGDPAVVVAPRGEGHVVLFGFDPLHRFQSHGDFALVWNALLNWDDLGVGLGEEDGEDEVAPAGGGGGAP